MIEGHHAGFYYVFIAGVLQVYTGKGVGSPLKSYTCDRDADEAAIHSSARRWIDRDVEALRAAAH